MNIRLHGTKGECAVAVQRIQEVLAVLSVSEPHPDRGASVMVRVYAEARIPETQPPTITSRPEVES